MSNFRRGVAANEAAAAASSAGFANTEYLKIEDGGSVIVRFLTDYDANEDPRTGELVGGFLGVKQHQQIPTKPQPSDYKSQKPWPSYMGAVCRKDSAFEYSDCYICDVMRPADSTLKAPAYRMFALACLREEVFENGQRVGVRDQVREVARKDANGKDATFQEKRIIVLNFGRKNFFEALEGWGAHLGTILDRDFTIKRIGEGIATDYQFYPFDPIDAEGPDGSVQRFDLREDFFMARYYPDALTIGYGKASDEALVPVIEDKASDKFYGRFFDPTYVALLGEEPFIRPQDVEDSVASVASAQVVTQTDEAVSQESISSLIDSLENMKTAHSSEPVASGMRDFG